MPALPEAKLASRTLDFDSKQRALYPMSIRKRIIFLFSFLLVCVLLLQYVHFRTVISRSMLSQAEQNGLKQLRLLRGLLQHQDDLHTPRDLHNYLQKMGSDLGLHLSYIAPDGALIADSEINWEALASVTGLARLPEIQQALDKKQGMHIRESEDSESQYIHLTLQCNALPGVTPGILKLTIPDSEMTEVLSSIQLDMFLTALLLIVLSVLVSWLVARQIGHQILSVSRKTQHIGSDNRYQPLELETTRELTPLVTSVNELIKRVNTDFEIISRQKEERDTVLNSLGEGVMVLDTTKRIRMANRIITTISLASGDPIGRKPMELFRSIALDGALDQCIVQDRTNPLTLQVVIPKERFFEINIVPIRSALNQTKELIVVFKEMTEQKRLEQMRKDFVANVSHELKTPLTSIKGYAEAILDGPVGNNPSVQNFIQIILKNAGKMEALIQDVLQLAKLESLQEKFQPELVDIPSAIHRAWEICTPSAKERNITLHLSLPETQIEVLSDYDQLVRVLVNLIENAIKYGPVEQEITISAKETQSEWTVFVENQGPSIPESLQDRLFERFFKAEVPASGNRTPGSGLGLAICKHIIENQGGRIWVQSPAPESLEGAIFSFSLPKTA
jgi:two-component system phosphate regulon sensor histidine kinase PhoR